MPQAMSASASTSSRLSNRRKDTSTRAARCLWRRSKTRRPSFCEKPVAHDVAEARALRRIARQKKVATQMGNQGMASDSFRRTLELIQEGAVGEVREVHLWFVFGGSGPRKVPRGSVPVPEYLDWNLWLGPARFRPYHPTWVNSAYAWRDFGTGPLGGGGSHSVNLAFKALKLGTLWEAGGEGKANIRVEAETSERCTKSYPRWEILRFDLPARGPLPPVRMHWYNAPEPQLKRMGIWQRLEKIAGRSLEWKDGSWMPRSGSLLVGMERRRKEDFLFAQSGRRHMDIRPRHESATEALGFRDH